MRKNVNSGISKDRSFETVQFGETDFGYSLQNPKFPIRNKQLDVHSERFRRNYSEASFLKAVALLNFCPVIFQTNKNSDLSDFSIR